MQPGKQNGQILKAKRKKQQGLVMVEVSGVIVHANGRILVVLYCRARLLCQTPRTSCRQENQGQNRFNRNSNNNNTTLFVRLPPHTLEALVEDALMTAQTQPGTLDASSATRTGEQGTAEAGIGFSVRLCSCAAVVDVSVVVTFFFFLR